MVRVRRRRYVYAEAVRSPCGVSTLPSRVKREGLHGYIQAGQLAEEPEASSGRLSACGSVLDIGAFIRNGWRKRGVIIRHC